MFIKDDTTGPATNRDRSGRAWSNACAATYNTTDSWPYQSTQHG